MCLTKEKNETNINIDLVVMYDSKLQNYLSIINCFFFLCFPYWFSNKFMTYFEVFRFTMKTLKKKKQFNHQQNASGHLII